MEGDKISLLSLVYILLIIVCIEESKEQTGEIYCIAHRGASAIRPENTFSAFDTAIQLNADYIEMDIQRTKDNQLIEYMIQP